MLSVFFTKKLYLCSRQKYMDYEKIIYLPDGYDGYDV